MSANPDHRPARTRRSCYNQQRSSMPSQSSIQPTSRPPSPSPLTHPAESRQQQQQQHTKRVSHRSRWSHPNRIYGRRAQGSALDITALPTLGDKTGIPGKAAHSSTLTNLYSISYLVLFSILGTLSRLGLQSLTFYPGSPVTISVLWANVAGTFLLGFLAEDQRLFRKEWGIPPYTPPRPHHTPRPSQGDEEAGPPSLTIAGGKMHNKVKKTIPLYIGLATGFCGSFTSFSSFMRDVFLAFVNDLPAPINHPISPSDQGGNLQRNGGYSFMAGLAVLSVTIGLCSAAFRVGVHFCNLVDPWTPSLPFRLTRYALDPLVVFLAWACWLGAVFMAVWPPDRPGGASSHGSWSNETWRGQAIFACVFAPLGCLLRYYLSLFLNPFTPSFPLGTFVVNIFGTAVIGMTYDLQHVQIRSFGAGGGHVGCQILQGLMDGFCGSLTTVSTWISELNELKRKAAYLYGVASVILGVLLLVVVMGSVKWTIGWSAIACAT